jgi:hypothetical protein
MIIAFLFILLLYLTGFKKTVNALLNIITMKLICAFLFITLILPLSTIAKPDPGLKSSLNNAVRDYLEIEKALAAGNYTLTIQKGQVFIWELGNVPDKGMEGDQHAQWFGYLNKMMRETRGITQGSSIDDQKQHFSELSNDFFDALKMFHVNSATIYKLSCSGDGRFWLSSSPVVKNPYYAANDKKKRACGVPAEVLKAGTK